ncbi:MAG: hypothetical protein Hens2KO_22100 [Henriciella sp.]
MLNSLFPLSLKAIHQNETVNLTRAGLISGTVYVIPRSQCRFERTWTPRADQKGVDAIKLSIAQNSNLENSGIFVEPTDDAAAGFLNCWVWDADQAAQHIKANSLLIPETYARVKNTEGARLVECMYGFEGQIWNKNSLLASRWWRSEPDEQDWLEFVEGSEVTTGTVAEAAALYRRKPRVSSVLWRDDVGLSDFGTAAIETTVTPLRAFLAASLVLSIPLAYAAGAAIKLTGDADRAQSRLELLQIELGDVADARRTSIANRAIIEKYQSAGDPFKMIDVFEQFGIATQPSEVTIRQLSYNGDSIEIRFTADERLLLPDLIRKLELSSHWTSASASRGTNNEIVLRGQLTAGGARL